jgi:hypothetical protein
MIGFLLASLLLGQCPCPQPEIFPPPIYVDRVPVVFAGPIVRRPAPICLDGSCAVPEAAPKPQAKPAAKPPAIPAAKPAAPAPPFPGPSLNPPRIVWCWDNGVFWDRSANTWYWQDSAGVWYHQP